MALLTVMSPSDAPALAVLTVTLAVPSWLTSVVVLRMDDAPEPVKVLLPFQAAVLAPAEIVMLVGSSSSAPAPPWAAVRSAVPE
jgi:hypothetical protein